jgi:hypothetical protein
MAMLECKLSEDELGLVFSCMDCHGHVTLDQVGGGGALRGGRVIVVFHSHNDP